VSWSSMSSRSMFGAGVGIAVPLFASDQGNYRDLPDVSPAPHRA
jgi:hypothetical protein